MLWSTGGKVIATSSSRGKRARGGSSLLAALREAGYEAGGPAPPQEPEAADRSTHAFNEDVLPELAGRLAHSAMAAGPPRWLRSARRERWRSRLDQAAAWIATLLIVGAIIALAGHFLARAPASPAPPPAIRR
jgi:hypothetical protein